MVTNWKSLFLVSLFETGWLLLNEFAYFNSTAHKHIMELVMHVVVER